jgi:arsenate reductase (thioredoxin)
MALETQLRAEELMLDKKRILFICTHNAARSQMAEGLVNRILTDSRIARSAGTKPSYVHPMAIKVMAEVGIDISDQRSKRLDELKGQEFDSVFTLCSEAEEIIFFLPWKRTHPPGLPRSRSRHWRDDEVMAEFRRVRDEIRAWIEATFKV